ncbi:hypothetical protein [Curtobacterium sp. PhB78]|uniref:hypothetical protein n=1 Tax=Curtobacterium sp. PhB78 TaxID=2485102 RepID=UPI0011CDAE0F|nr:hypothetical protein [Curtobacterium sp. PhB78]
MGARRRTRSAAAIATTLGALLALAACTMPPPPHGSESALADLIADVDRLPGVGSTEGEIRQFDAKDDPDNWLTSLRVTADTADLAVAERVRRTAERGVTGTTLQVTLDVPSARKTAPVSLDPMDRRVVGLAGRLRTRTFVRQLWMTPTGSRIGLVRDVSFSDAAKRVRTITGPEPTNTSTTRTTTLSRGDVSVDVTATHPGRALMRMIDTLADDHHVERLHYSPGTTYADAARAPDDASGLPAVADRPSLSIGVRPLGDVAETLAATTDEAADAHRAPRTAFDLGSGAVSGWLGLPLDAPKPRDAGPDGDAPTSPTPTPWVPADVDDRAIVLRAFLERSAAAAGVPATVTTGTEQCATSGSSDPTGTRATALSVVPVFDVVDDAQEPFDAVTALWTSEGLGVSDRAMGRDSWSSSSGADPATASIRGTVDGLSLTAESACVPPPDATSEGN